MNDEKRLPVQKLVRAPLALVALLACSHATVARAEKVEQLSPQGYVNDFANVLDSDTRQHLTALCQELDQRANAQIAVVN